MAERELETALVLTGRDASRAAFLSAKANAQGLMKSMKNLSAFGGIPSVTSAFGGLGRSMIGAGRAAKDLIANVAQIGGLASALSIGALTAGLAGVAQKIDDLDDAAKKIGISTQSLREFTFVAKLAGVAQETVVSGLTQATQTWAQARAGYGRATTALKKLNPELLAQIQHAKSSGEAFNIMLSAIENASDEGTKNLLSQIFFGSSEFAKIAADGAKANAKAMDEARKVLGVITQSQVEGIKAFNDNIDIFKGSIEGVLSVTMAKLAPALSPFVEQMTALVVQNREFIANSITNTVVAIANAIKAVDWVAFGHNIEAIATAANHAAQWVGGWQNVMIGVAALPFADLILNLSKVAFYVGAIGLSMAKWLVTGQAFTDAMVLIRTVGGTVAGVVASISLPVWGLIAAMVAAGVAIYKYWQPLKALVTGFAEGISKALGPAVEALQPLLDAMAPAVNATASAFAWVGRQIEPLIGWFGNILEPVKLTSAEFAGFEATGRRFGEMVGSAIGPAVKSLAAVITGTFQTTFREAKAVVDGVRTALEWLGKFDVGPIKAMAENVLGFFHFDLTGVGAGWVKALIAGVMSIPPDPIGALATKLLNYFKLDLYPVAVGWTTALWDGAKAGSAQLIVNIAGLAGDVVRWFKGIDFVAIGRGWIDALVEGIQAAAGSLMATVEGLAGDIARALNPSNWFQSTDALQDAMRKNNLAINPKTARSLQTPAAPVGHRATGGSVRPGDMTWVGERGPELVRWGKDGQVISNAASSKLAMAAFNPEQRRMTDTMARLTAALTDLTNAIKLDDTSPGLGGQGGGSMGSGGWRTFGDYGHHPGQPGGGRNAAPRPNIAGGWKGANIGPISKTSAGRAEQAMALLMADGWTREQAAGMVGNLQHESAGFADNVIAGQRRGDKGSAFGIGQWRHERIGGLMKFAAQRQKAMTDFATQVLYYSHEFRTTEAAAGRLMKQARTVHEATDAAIASERPRGWRPGHTENVAGHDERLSYARAADDLGRKLAAEERTKTFKPPINDAVAQPVPIGKPMDLGKATLDVNVRTAPGTQAGARLKTEGNLTGKVGRDGVGSPDFRPGVNSPIFGPA